MCDGFQITLPSGEQVCLPRRIFYYSDWWIHEPDPPEIVDNLFAEVMVDIVTLTTINELIARLRDDVVRERLVQTLHETVESIAQQLPEGIRIGDRLLEVSPRPMR